MCLEKSKVSSKIAFLNAAQNGHCYNLYISIWISYVPEVFSVLWRQLR